MANREFPVGMVSGALVHPVRGVTYFDNNRVFKLPAG